jgi:hypothetical protein
MERIRWKERQIEQARAALRESVIELKRVLHRRLSSRTAMAVGFAAGWLLGWRRPRRAGGNAARATARARHNLPYHWMRNYFVWPFLLRIARDLVLAQRPSRREA